MAPSPQAHTITWDQRQAELWDRVFQVTSDVVSLAGSFDDDDGGDVIKEEMIKAAMQIGVALVKANVADTAAEFRQHVKDGRLKAVETDYWLRLAYILQQRDDVQRDLSGIITQYASIIELLEKLERHSSRPARSSSGAAVKPKLKSS